MLILNGLYCDTIFVTEYYGVAWWRSSLNKSDNFNNSLKCGRRIIDNTHSHEIVSSLHVLNVHIQYVHYTHTHTHLLENFARWIAKLFFLHTESVYPRERRQTKMSSESSAVKTEAFLFLFLFLEDLSKKLRKKRERERESLKKTSYLIDAWRL